MGGGVLWCLFTRLFWVPLITRQYLHGLDLFRHVPQMLNNSGTWVLRRPSTLCHDPLASPVQLYWRQVTLFCSRGRCYQGVPLSWGGVLGLQLCFGWVVCVEWHLHECKGQRYHSRTSQDCMNAALNAQCFKMLLNNVNTSFEGWFYKNYKHSPLWYVSVHNTVDLWVFLMPAWYGGDVETRQKQNKPDKHGFCSYALELGVYLQLYFGRSPFWSGAQSFLFTKV